MFLFLSRNCSVKRYHNPHLGSFGWLNSDVMGFAYILLADKCDTIKQPGAFLCKQKKKTEKLALGQTAFIKHY